MGLDGANTRLGLAWTRLGMPVAADAKTDRLTDRAVVLDKRCVLIDKAWPSSDYVTDAIRSSKSANFGQVVCMY